jgi:hypothetical protein
MSRRLEKSLRDSVQQMPRADLEIISNSDVAKLEQHDYITRQEVSSSIGLGRVLLLVVFAVVIVVCIAVVFIGNNTVHSMVTMDINAGFIITGNRKGDVLSVRGVDEAARSILRNVDFTGIDVKELAGILIYDSAGQKFLTNEEPYILISVWDRDEKNSRKLLTSISEQANISSSEWGVYPVVLGQYLDRSGSLERNAEQRGGVTAGRLQLIDFLLELRPSFTTEQLLLYNISGLLRVARAADITLPISEFRFTEKTDTEQEEVSQNNNSWQTSPITGDTLPIVEIVDIDISPPDVTPSPKTEPTRASSPPEPTVTEQAEYYQPTEAITEPEPEPVPMPTEPAPEPTQAPEPEPEPTPYEDISESLREVTESLWASIADDYQLIGDRQLNLWRGQPDSQAQIDREFDILQERAAALGDEFYRLGRQYREYYQNQYESIMGEREWNSW